MANSSSPLAVTTMPKTIEFPKSSPEWVFSRDCVRFFALVDGKVVPCFVTLEALMEHFPVGAVDPGGASSLRSFQEHRTEIERVARRKLEATENERSPELLLRSDDFPPLSATAASRRVKFLTSTESLEIRQDPALLSKIDQVNSLLEEDHVRRRMPITANWDLLPTSGESLVQLVLKDDVTGAEADALFTRADGASLATDWFSLFRIWDNLMGARGDRLRRALEIHVGTEE